MHAVAICQLCSYWQVTGGQDAQAVAQATSEAVAEAIATAYTSASGSTTVQGSHCGSMLYRTCDILIDIQKLELIRGLY